MIIAYRALILSGKAKDSYSIAKAKSGQIIALIGDLKGISVEIDVPEIDIDKIHPGMSAKISGIAFGKFQLKGKLVSVNVQASNSSNGGLPSFTEAVEVGSLTLEQRIITTGSAQADSIVVETGLKTGDVVVYD